MKKLFYLILCCCTFPAFAGNRTFAKLSEVNKCWTEQADISQDALPAYHDQSETEWIRTHLALVEATLRKRDVHHLPLSQQRSRMQCLNDLHTYWQTGNFPVNDAYAFRTPIFIDKYDNFCAVGYLVKASGHEGISRMIAANTNLAYVRQMNYPELNEWATNNGFTTAELAWIQPGYPPSAACGPIGQGVNGVVNELYGDEAAGKLYVGGNFSEAIGATAAANIAYVTQGTSGVYTWHKMGSGVPGTVNAITKFDGKIFAAGQFAMAGAGMATSAVAYWDGSTWTAAGCLNGTVKDLAVFKGVLYACGNFDDCSGLFAPQFFAKWDGSSWHSIDGIMDRVNTMEVMAGDLVLGGSFSYLGGSVNILKWTASGTFQPYTNVINNEVMDLQVYADTLYAACKRTHATDTNSLIMKLRAGVWSSALPEHNMQNFHPYSGELSFNTLCRESTGLNTGGRFSYNPLTGTYAQNCIKLAPGAFVAVDSTVNKMEYFNGELIIAGAFKTGGSGGWGGNVTVNGITVRTDASAGLPNATGNNVTTTIFPNPVAAGGVISVSGNFDADGYTLCDVMGRQVAAGAVSTAKTVALPQMPAGMYFITLTDTRGEQVVQKLQVK